MRYLLAIFIALVLTVSCKHNEGPTNEYKNAKVHASDTYQKEHKRAAKKAKKDGQKTMRKARRERNKKNRNWGKKGGSYE